MSLVMICNFFVPALYLLHKGQKSVEAHIDFVENVMLSQYETCSGKELVIISHLLEIENVEV